MNIRKLPEAGRQHRDALEGVQIKLRSPAHVPQRERDRHLLA